MVKTRAEVKNKWNTAKYERINFVLKAGDKARLKAVADRENVSVNRYIIDSINAREPGLLSPLDDKSRQKKQTGPEEQEAE